jgi:hypothetical protein
MEILQFALLVRALLSSCHIEHTYSSGPSISSFGQCLRLQIWISARTTFWLANSAFHALSALQVCAQLMALAHRRCRHQNRDAPIGYETGWSCRTEAKAACFCSADAFIASIRLAIQCSRQFGLKRARHAVGASAEGAG